MALVSPAMGQNRRVPGRRLIILLVLLLISLSVLSASRDVSRTRLPGATTSTTPATTSEPKPGTQPSASATSGEKKAAGASAGTTRVRLPKTGTAKVPLGSRVVVSVRTAVPEIVAVDQLGVRAPAGPGTRGTLDFIASSTGRFPVTLAVSGRRIGELEVQD